MVPKALSRRVDKKVLSICMKCHQKRIQGLTPRSRPFSQNLGHPEGGGGAATPEYANEGHITPYEKHLNF